MSGVRWSTGALPVPVLTIERAVRSDAGSQSAEAAIGVITSRPGNRVTLVTIRWRRLTDRLAGKNDTEVLYEGLPDHLAIPVRSWVLDVAVTFTTTGFVAVRLRLPSSILASRDPAKALASHSDPKNDMIFMEIVDATLAALNEVNPYGSYRRRPHEYRNELEMLLKEGGSAYAIGPDGDGLVLRVDETLRHTLDKAVEAADAQKPHSGDHLREAFAAAYGIKPNPSVAYSQAIKAVEAVANPVFLPKSPEPTLGAVRSSLDQGRHKYEMVIADRAGAPAGIDAAVELLNLLWHGQRDRHAGGPTSLPVTQEAAETAVHAAALLVHWIASDGIRKK